MSLTARGKRIRHVIRDGAGGTKEVLLTPIKAIRYHCLECVGFSYAEVTHCTSPLCPLFPYRLGKRPQPGAPEAHGDA